MAWEEEEVQRLHSSLENAPLRSENESASLQWTATKEGIFTVSSLYKLKEPERGEGDIF